jgi:Fe-S-cluster containining protein
METGSPETVQVNFTLAVGERKLNASVEVPAGTVTVTELLPILQALTSQVAGGVAEQAAAAGHPVSCRVGCGACCRQLVPLSIFEAEGLAGWIRGLPEAQQRALEGRFHAALLGLRDAGILDRLSPELWEEGSEEAKRVVIDYLKARVACPFLVEESCSIHPIRPLVCREYMVTSPSEFCVEPVANQVSGVRMPVKLSKALYRLGAKLENEGTGWIPLVFLFHWMRSGAEPGRRLSGPGPQVLHGIFAELQS